MNTKYLKIFSKKPSKGKNIIRTIFKDIILTRKQKIAVILTIASFLFYTIGYAQFILAGGLVGGGIHQALKIQGVTEVLNRLSETNGGDIPSDILKEFIPNWRILDIPKNFLEYISDIQVKSIEVLNKLPFGSETMFIHIEKGLTIFAVIGCLYQLVKHFFKTERFDNTGAFTGFFKYLGVALLFVFSDSIVERVVNLNEGVNTAMLQSMSQTLNQELDKVLLQDVNASLKKIANLEDKNKDIEEKIEDSWIGVAERIEKMKNNLEIWKISMVDAYFALLFKYIYFSFFIMAIASIMAIPAFIISFMIKVLLTVMVAGTKLVFLLAFIPGFENMWKSFLSNMLNILLWAPIFNALFGFITVLIIGLMSDSTLQSGQIVWLTIVAIILAFQSISLTTTAAGVIIQGAGASMAGAMGALTTMSGVGVGTSIAKTAVGVAGSVAGSSISAGMTAKSISKFMSK